MRLPVVFNSGADRPSPPSHWRNEMNANEILEMMRKGMGEVPAAIE